MKEKETSDNRQKMTRDEFMSALAERAVSAKTRHLNATSAIAYSLVQFGIAPEDLQPYVEKTLNKVAKEVDGLTIRSEASDMEGRIDEVDALLRSVDNILHSQLHTLAQKGGAR